MERGDLVFITIALEELCTQLPGTLPAGFMRELLVAPLAAGISTAMQQAEGWSAAAEGLGERQEEARELGRRLAALAPMLRRRDEEDEDEPDPRPVFPPVDDAAEESETLRRELEEESAGEAAQFTFGDPFDETRRTSADTFGQPIDVFWSESFVKREAARMLAFSRQIEAGQPPEKRPPLCVRFEQTTEAELSGQLDARRTFAQTFSSSVQHMPRATREQGMQVHETIQKRYRTNVRHNRFVAEWRVYNVRLPHRFQRNATITEMVHYERNKLRLGITDNPDLTYLTLDLARLADKPGKPPDDIRTKYRWDLINLDLRKIWEIKPVHSLEKAVNQEFFYRTKFNYTAFRIQYNPRRKKGRVKTEAIAGGLELPLEGADGSPFIPLKDGNTAVPFTLAALPGIIPYFILETETSVEDLLRTLRKLFKDIEEAALFVVENWVMILVFIVVVAIVAYLLLFLISQMETGSAPPGSDTKQLPAAGSGEAVKVPTGVGAVPVMIGFADRQPQPVLRMVMPGESQTSGEDASISFGKMTIYGLSAARMGDLVRLTSEHGGAACASALQQLKAKAQRATPGGDLTPRA